MGRGDGGVLGVDAIAVASGPIGGRGHGDSNVKTENKAEQKEESERSMTGRGSAMSARCEKAEGWLFVNEDKGGR